MQAAPSLEISACEWEISPVLNSAKSPPPRPWGLHLLPAAAVHARARAPLPQHGGHDHLDLECAFRQVVEDQPLMEAFAALDVGDLDAAEPDDQPRQRVVLELARRD